MQKFLSTPTNDNKKMIFKLTESKVGELTKEYIEKNRKILKEKKKKAKGNRL